MSRQQEQFLSNVSAQFLAEEKLAKSAQDAVAAFRQAILRGDNVAKWVLNLLDAIDTWDNAGPGEISYVSVGLVLKEKGVIE